MPTAISPFVLADWIQPGAALTVVLGLAGFLWTEIPSVRAEMQTMRAEFKTEIQALLSVQGPQRSAAAKA